MIVAYRRDRSLPVFARDIKADGAMTVPLKDAMQPNPVQTLETTRHSCMSSFSPTSRIDCTRSS
jgi:formyltetrahydrofolate synthetase